MGNVGTEIEAEIITDMRWYRLLVSRKVEDVMFDFRIIEMETGDQIIDQSMKTPYNALTPLQMVEYLEMDNRLAYMNRMERKARVDAERKRKIARNPIYKLACLCRMV